jgi:hypothetical protein
LGHFGKISLEGGMVLKENKQALSLNMILGKIGTILITLAAMRYQAKENDYIGFLIFLIQITGVIAVRNCLFFNYWAG